MSGTAVDMPKKKSKRLMELTNPGKDVPKEIAIDSKDRFCKACSAAEKGVGMGGKRGNRLVRGGGKK